MSNKNNENNDAGKNFAESLNLKEVRLSAARSAIKVTWFQKQVPVLIGESGIGKTALVHDLAEEMDAQVYIFSCSNADPTDLVGPLMPRRDGTYTYLRNAEIPVEYKPTLEDEYAFQEALMVLEDEGIRDDLAEIETRSEQLRELQARLRVADMLDEELEKRMRRATLNARMGEMRSKKRMILFLDELNRMADEAMKNALFPVWNERKLGNYKLGENVWIIGAMNPHDSDYNVSDIGKDPAERRRLVWIPVETNYQLFVRWARKEALHPVVVNFVSQNEDVAYDKMARAKGEVYANFATWEKISDMLYAIEKDNLPVDGLLTYLTGMIGLDQALEFMSAYRDTSKKLLNLPAIVEHLEEGDENWQIAQDALSDGEFQTLAAVAPQLGEMFAESYFVVIQENTDAENMKEALTPYHHRFTMWLGLHPANIQNTIVNAFTSRLQEMKSSAGKDRALRMRHRRAVHELMKNENYRRASMEMSEAKKAVNKSEKEYQKELEELQDK